MADLFLKKGNRKTGQVNKNSSTLTTTTTILPILEQVIFYASGKYFNYHAVEIVVEMREVSGIKL